MVMDLVRLGPVLSSKSGHYFDNQAIVGLKKRKGKIWSWEPKEGLTPRQTGRLTIDRNTRITLTST
jgi:hypothetical protein